MQLPWFKIGSAVVAATGLAGLCWYGRLSPAQKAAADRMARDLAVEMFNKELHRLSEEEYRRVHSRVEAFFEN
jgi:hypothetical protein